MHDLTVEDWQLIFTGISTIWENIYGCAEQYIGTTKLYLLYRLSQAFDIIFVYGINALGHGKEVVDGINDP